MDDLVKRLRVFVQGLCSSMWQSRDQSIKLMDEAADRIEKLEADVKAVLRREADANRAAMNHLRALEKERIKSANYAAFSTEWRKKCEDIEARIAAADALAEAVTHEREMVCQDFGLQQDAAFAVDANLAAYQATKEGE